MSNIPANLLNNPSFEEGYYYHNRVPELAMPNEWTFWFAPSDEPKLERQDDAWARPETVVWNRGDAPEQEKDLFFLDGIYCFKCFGAWRPIWWKLMQAVTGLTPQTLYRFTVPIFPDLVMRYEGRNKVFADDMLAGEHRLIATSGGQVCETGWLNGNQVPFGRYTHVTLDFAPPDSDVELTVEVRGRWGLKNNGWFMDKLELAAVTQPPPQPVDVAERLREIAAELNELADRVGAA